VKKIILTIILFCITAFNIFSLVEKNEYNDIGLNEKNGTYGFDSYMRKSTLSFITAVSSETTYDPAKGWTYYSEIGGRIKMLLDFPEMGGFFFNGDMFISKNSLKTYTSGDLAWWNSFVPYMGDTHIGYKNKYFTVKLGFQNLVSSDAIYNHLMIDDYSGSLPAIRLNSMLGRFVDIELIYAMIRPHQSAWYSGTTKIETDNTQDDSTLYDVYYGKSLYTHKINIRPLPWIRIGVYEGVYFLGENINPWYANPFFMYIGSQLLDDTIADKAGSRFNTHAANLLAGVDFNIGFNGWRIFGEFLVDDFNGEYFKFQKPSHPDKFAFTLGFELRGYLLTKYIKMSSLAAFIVGNLYVNFEYGIVSKYTYSRDSNFNYEYVRDEYKGRYKSSNPPSAATVEKVNRIGNFLGFMYGPNSDSIDVAIGWRSDLYNVKEYSAGYQGDVYFQSFKEKRIPKRLFKIQLHFRNYRLGDERDVIMPYYWNEHPTYDLDTGEEKVR